MGKLSLKNIVKSFGQFDVVKNVSLEVNEGGFMVFVGPSGCGKSTLLRMIAGLEDTTSGDIVIDEKRVNDLPPVKRGIAMVFQSYALYPHMSVYENIAFPLRVEGADNATISARWNMRPRSCIWISVLSRSLACCPAVSASAWPLAVRLCVNRRFSCSMSRFQTLMQRFAPICVSN